MSGDDDQQEQTIADDLVVTKYKMGADIANRKCFDKWGLARLYSLVTLRSFNLAGYRALPYVKLDGHVPV